MILVQASTLLSPKADAVLEILALLSVATVLGWLLANLLYAGRVNTLRDHIADKQAQLAEYLRQKSGLKGSAAVAEDLVLETPMHIEPPSAVPGITSYTEPPILEVPRLPVEQAEVIAVTTAPLHEDLKVIEGVGPKIEALLNEAGLFSFGQLAEADPESLRQILDAAGSRFQMHDPTSWPQQALLASQGQWGELKKLQDELIGGKS